MQCTAKDIKNLGTILGIWAHPDDESFCMGGMMACATSNGQRVACITATRGDAGKTADESKWPQSKLTKIRSDELEQALNILGVNEHYWLDYNDGELAQSDANKAVAEITALIDKVQPDSIFSFCKDGITGHNDHRTIHTWTKRAIEHSESSASLYCAVEIAERYNSDINKQADEAFNIYFNIDQPRLVPINELDLYFELPEDVHNKKLEALQAQASQTAKMFESNLGKSYIEIITRDEGFVVETL